MSNSDTVISVEGVAKSYLIGHKRQTPGYHTFRETLVRSLKGFGRAAADTLRGRQIVEGEEMEQFWALKDVSFAVKRGEVLGIIGRNGSGKSTLLKILSRITEPTEGRVRIMGRVASLLEVGTGFHPELTGRENVYLNGAILGMTRREIKKRFDEIVAFAEVSNFLDTPVKRYSSGMYVRLAFAVAAHLEPEILIIDEVLAVGDSEFQKKCISKMNEVAGGGRTALFVSHNLDAVRRLCDRVVVLSHGKTVYLGETHTGIDIYMTPMTASQSSISFRLGTVEFEMSPLRVRPKTESQGLDFEIVTSATTRVLEMCLIIDTITGQRVGLFDLRCSDSDLHFVQNEQYTVSIDCDYSFLAEDDYEAVLWAQTPEASQNTPLGRIHFGGSLANERMLTAYGAPLNGLVRFVGQITIHKEPVNYSTWGRRLPYSEQAL